MATNTETFNQLELAMNFYEDNAPELGEASDERSMTFEEYQEHRERCEFLVRQSEMAERLAKNSDFQAVIMEAYLNQEPVRLGHMIASGRLNEAGVQGCVNDLRGIAHLRTHLSMFVQNGNIARGELANLEEARKAFTEENAVN